LWMTLVMLFGVAMPHLMQASHVHQYSLPTRFFYNSDLVYYPYNQKSLT
jgi:hypothetical protein